MYVVGEENGGLFSFLIKEGAFGHILTNVHAMLFISDSRLLRSYHLYFIF